MGWLHGDGIRLCWELSNRGGNDEQKALSYSTWLWFNSTKQFSFKPTPNLRYSVHSVLCCRRPCCIWNQSTFILRFICRIFCYCFQYTSRRFFSTKCRLKRQSFIYLHSFLGKEDSFLFGYWIWVEILNRSSSQGGIEANSIVLFY